MGKLRACLELCRASNLPTVWTNALAAAVLSGGARPLQGVIAGASVTLTYLGGMALNDVLDLEEDRVKKPFRPIPSGRITRAAAAALAALLFGIALLLLGIFCPGPAWIAGVALLGTVYLYDRLHPLSAATVLLMAACRALVFVVVALAVSDAVSRAVSVGAAAQFLYIVALTAVARWEKAAPRSFRIPPIPWMLAGISLVDGIVLALLAGPFWLLAGAAGFTLTRMLQSRVRGD